MANGERKIRLQQGTQKDVWERNNDDENSTAFCYTSGKSLQKWKNESKQKNFIVTSSTHWRYTCHIHSNTRYGTGQNMKCLVSAIAIADELLSNQIRIALTKALRIFDGTTSL